jgi:hypothetical protein
MNPFGDVVGRKGVGAEARLWVGYVEDDVEGWETIDIVGQGDDLAELPVCQRQLYEDDINVRYP